MSITPKNWDNFQHYKDRSPAWIKLHRGLLDDFTFSRLPVASRALAPLLWLLASEYEGGKITASTDELAFRLRMSHSELTDALKPLIDSGFFNASEPLADCKQEAIPEREKEEENIDKRKRENYAQEFDALWAEYPNKVGKQDALRAFVKSRKSGHDIETIACGLTRYIHTKPPDRSWLNLATFINGQRWNDQPAAPLTAVAKPLTEFQRKQQETSDVTAKLRAYSNSLGGGGSPDRLLSDNSGEQPGGVRGRASSVVLAIPGAFDRGGS